MAFDFSTAQAIDEPPRKKSGGFDFSTAKPVNTSVARRVLNLTKTAAAPLNIFASKPVIPLQIAGKTIENAVTNVGDRMIPAETGGFLDPVSAAPGNIVKMEAGAFTPEQMAIGLGTEGIGRMILPSVGKMAGAAVKKGASAMSDVSEEAISSAIKNPEVIDATFKGTTEALPKTVAKMNQAISAISDVAKGKLSKSRFIEPSVNYAGVPDTGGAFTKDEVIGQIAKARKELGGVYTPESETASKVLNKIKSNLNKITTTVSQNHVSDLIGDLDAEINWDRVRRAPQDLTATEKSLVNARTYLDSMLKKKNPEYAKEVAKVSDLIQNRNEFLNNFKLDKAKGGYVPSDQAYPKVANALKDSKIETQRILGRTKELTGDDVEQQIKNAAQGEEFSTSGKGRKFTMAGAGVGGFAGQKVAGYPGAATGIATGGAVGAAIDKKAPQIVGDLIRLWVKGKPLFIPLKYIPLSEGIRAIPQVTRQDDETKP